jgi:hypothetical protein
MLDEIMMMKKGHGCDGVGGHFLAWMRRGYSARMDESLKKVALQIDQTRVSMVPV